MKKISLWVMSTLSVVVLLFSYHTSTSGALASGTSSSLHAAAFSASAPLTSGVSGGTGEDTSGSGTSTTKSTTKTVTGDVAQTRWGPVQVELTLAGSKITNVSVVQYPTGNHRDEEINSYALPILTQETISAQSASIDMVSGATVTSDGYLQSLQSALDQVGL